MLAIFRKIIHRIQALLIADAALGLEAEFLARHADRKAELLQKAQDYKQQGLDDLAEELRSQVRTFSIDKPVSSVLPALSHLNDAATETDRAKLERSIAARNGLPAFNGLKPKKVRKVVRAKAH